MEVGECIWLSRVYNISWASLIHAGILPCDRQFYVGFVYSGFHLSATTSLFGNDAPSYSTKVSCMVYSLGWHSKYILQGLRLYCTPPNKVKVIEPHPFHWNMTAKSAWNHPTNLTAPKWESQPAVLSFFSIKLQFQRLKLTKTPSPGWQGKTTYGFPRAFPHARASSTRALLRKDLEDQAFIRDVQVQNMRWVPQSRAGFEGFTIDHRWIQPPEIKNQLVLGLKANLRISPTKNQSPWIWWCYLAKKSVYKICNSPMRPVHFVGKFVCSNDTAWVCPEAVFQSFWQWVLGRTRQYPTFGQTWTSKLKRHPDLQPRVSENPGLERHS